MGGPGKVERNNEICALYAEGLTLKQIGERYGISFQAVSGIIARYRAKVPLRDRAEIIQEHTQTLDYLMTRASEIVESDPLPKYRSGDHGDVDNDGNPVDATPIGVDHTGRLAAMRELRKLQERESRLLGLDAVKTEIVEQTVRYVIDTGEAEAMQ
jgi:DNA-binding CsgD family transcriptional regulator